MSCVVCVRAKWWSFLADQRGDDARPVWVDYFGTKVLANGVFAKFAAEGAAYVFPIVALRTPDGRYRCVYGDEIPIQRTNDKDNDLMVNSQRFHQVFEAWLRRTPNRVFGCIGSSRERAGSAREKKLLPRFPPIKCNMTSRVIPPAPPSRIVVRGTNWVGDTVMSVPAIKELRRIFPSTRITLWVASGLAPLVSATGVPDDVICFDGNSGGPMQRPFRMRKKLNSGNFDMSVLLQNAFESAFSSWLAGIPLRAGYPTDLRGPLLNIRIPLTRQIRSKHQVFYYLAITRFLEVYLPGPGEFPEGPPDCSIPIKEENCIRARDLIASRGAGLERPIFCVCPGSVNSEAKRWPAESFARLADLLIDRIGAQVVFLGAPQEKSLVEGIISIMRNSGSLNLVGADMMTSMAVMNLSALVISNDTGSAHLAVASSARVLTIFGPTNPGATAPYGANTYVIQGHAPCAPCRHFRCPLQEHPCMSSVEPEAVLHEAEEILSGFPCVRE